MVTENAITIATRVTAIRVTVTPATATLDTATTGEGSAMTVPIPITTTAIGTILTTTRDENTTSALFLLRVCFKS